MPPMRSGPWTSFSTAVPEGWVIKCLTIVDDATHESVAVVPERDIEAEQELAAFAEIWDEK